MRGTIRLIMWGGVGALTLIGLFFFPDLIPFLPRPRRWYPVEWTVAVLFAGYFLIRVFGKSRFLPYPQVEQSNRILDRADGISRELLERWLIFGFSGLSILWLLLWVPHYLFWPWCRDT